MTVKAAAIRAAAPPARRPRAFVDGDVAGSEDPFGILADLGLLRAPPYE